MSSATSAKSGLDAFAAQMGYWSQEFAKIANDNGASAEKQQKDRQNILDAVATVNSDAKRVQVLISAIADNKRNELAEGVGKARGHFDRFKVGAAGAQHWLNTHHFEDDHLSLSDAETAISTYVAHISEKIVDDDKHSGDRDTTLKISIETNLAALKDDVTAVEKRSWPDVDRIKKHVAALQQVGEKGHPLMHQHQKDLSELRERIRELDKTPQIQGDLTISANGLLGLMQ